MNYISKISILIFLLLILGCKNPFHPEIRINDPEPVSSGEPEDLLKKLETSYNNMDINMYESCLTSDFQFYLIASEYSEIGIDIDGDDLKDNYWFKEQEVEYHRNLFGSGSSDGKYPAPSNISLVLVIPPQNIWYINDQDTLESEIVIPCDFKLSLYFDFSGSITSEGKARFIVREVNNEWKICKWLDESNI